MHKIVNKLAIITTHPIQYYAPIFRLLNSEYEIEIKVFYTWSQSKEGIKYDPGFGKKIEWDIPLLDGYDFTFVKNTSAKPGSHHFFGIKNPTLIPEIESWKPDAVLVIGWSFVSHLQCIRYFHKKIPVLFRGDSTLLDEGPGIKTMLRRLFLKWVYSHVDVAFYVGTNNKVYFLKHGLKNEQLVFAPHAVDNGRFGENAAYKKMEALAWRSKLGIAASDLVFLFAGKLEPKKNPAILIESFSEIKNEKIKLVLLGDGILKEQLKSLSKNDERISFVEFQNQQEMPVVYRMADVFVLPSKGPGETWGLAVNEAMACGRAILVSDKVGCAADLVADGKNGYIFRSNDIASLKEKINKLVSNKNGLAEMGKASAALINEWNFEAIASAVKNVLKQA